MNYILLPLDGFNAWMNTLTPILTSKQYHLRLIGSPTPSAQQVYTPQSTESPTTFLQRIQGTNTPTRSTTRSKTTLRGIHGSTQAGDNPLLDQVYQVARLNAIKLMTIHNPSIVHTIRAIDPTVYILVRIFEKMGDRYLSPRDFVNGMLPDVKKFYDTGVRDFEIHNEPNHPDEWQWENESARDTGKRFGLWFNEVCTLLKQTYPDIRCGYPGLSPVPDPRLQYWYDFLQGGISVGALQTADFICCHCYWGIPELINDPAWGRHYQYFLTTFPDKEILITEFSRPQGNDYDNKGKEYKQYFESLQGSGIKAAFSYVLSGSGWDSEAWVINNQLTAIPYIV